MNEESSYPYVDELNNLLYLNSDTIIINNPIEIKWGGGNKKHYTKLGYDCQNWKKPFNINVQEIQKCSNIKVDIICPKCNKQRPIIFSNLIISGNSNCKSCSKIKDLKNQVFDRLTVKKFIRLNKNKHAIWLCKCECGNFKEIVGIHLRSGRTRSCGCLHSEIVSERMTGDTHPMWNPELTDEHRENCRMAKENKQWAKDIKEKDNYTCQCCGTYGGVLESHHLNNYKDFPDIQCDINNGVTLCKDCHIQFHSWVGGYRVTCIREDLVDFCNTCYPDALFLQIQF